MKYTYKELARMIDHPLLHPTMTDPDMDDGCRIAAKYGVASVSWWARPSDFPKAIRR